MKIRAVFNLLFLLFVVGIATSSYHSYRHNHYDTRLDADMRYNIYSLNTQSETNGIFVLCVGTIDNEDYYVFYIKNEYGGLRREKIPCDRCTIYEGFSTPQIIEYGQEERHFVDGKIIDSTFRMDDYSRWRHEICVPTGSITQKINQINL